MIAHGLITLRHLEERDMGLLQNLINDPDISSSVVDYGFPVSSVQQDEWFNTRFPHENAYRFMVEAKRVTVGALIFNNIDQENKTGILGYKIARGFQGKGYATSAVCAITVYLFDKTDIECIIVPHLHTNISSKRVIEKAGFHYDGTQRKAIYRNGQRLDMVYWSCSREHFNEVRKDLM